MTLLGAGASFSIGSNNVTGSDPAMTKSLDEIIQDRRKQQQQESKRGPKKPTTVDKSIASGRAKREAAMKQRRGLSETKKPTAMEVDKQVKRQTEQSAKEKANQDKKATKGRIAPDSTVLSTKKKNKKKKKAATAPAPAPIFSGRTPPKKAIEAAVKGMESAGFQIPQGHTVVMTYVPVVVPAPPKAAPVPAPKANETKKPDGKGKKTSAPKKKPANKGK